MCLPALHISLGVFYRLYTLLEHATHELDLALAREKSDCGQLGGRTFNQYTELLHSMHQLKEERDAHLEAAGALDQLLTRMALCLPTEQSATTQIQCVAEAITSYRKKADELVYIYTGQNTLVLLTCRFCRSLRLTKFNERWRRALNWRKGHLSEGLMKHLRASGFRGRPTTGGHLLEIMSTNA